MEDVSIIEWILLGAFVLLLVLLIALRAAISGLEAQLVRMQKSLDERLVQPSSENTSAEKSGAFEQFLAEDPTRLVLSKTEQFSAYRKWLKENGMNWSA